MTRMYAASLLCSIVYLITVVTGDSWTVLGFVAFALLALAILNDPELGRD